jgi:hypothetical protein
VLGFGGEGVSRKWFEINVNAVRTERSRQFGDVWLALELLKKLQLDRFFQGTLASAHAKIFCAHLATVLVTARFCEPKSELHLRSSCGAGHRYIMRRAPHRHGCTRLDIVYAHE